MLIVGNSEIYCGFFINLPEVLIEMLFGAVEDIAGSKNFGGHLEI